MFDYQIQYHWIFTEEEFQMSQMPFRTYKIIFQLYLFRLSCRAFTQFAQKEYDVERLVAKGSWVAKTATARCVVEIAKEFTGNFQATKYIISGYIYIYYIWIWFVVYHVISVLSYITPSRCTQTLYHSHDQLQASKSSDGYRMLYRKRYHSFYMDLTSQNSADLQLLFLIL